MSKPIIDHLRFPDYAFREYPKWVTPDGGGPVLVASAAAERALLQPAKTKRPKRKPARRGDKPKSRLA